jgi:phosphatidylserine/phosphatidylglycerophosphate/cardiolipin synthase-like enzyme
MKSFWGVLVLSLFTSSRTWALPETYFSGEGVQQRLLALISQSHNSIDLAVFEFSSAILAAALRHARERGVTVRLLLDAHAMRTPPKKTKGFSLSGLNVRQLAGRSNGFGVMHDKFAIFDERVVVTGSYNWTNGAEHSNYENVLIEDDPVIVSKYRRQFALLWSKSAQKQPENSSRFRAVLKGVGRALFPRRSRRRRKL